MNTLVEKKVSAQFGDAVLSLQTGRLAQMASGSVLACWGETVVLATAVIGQTPQETDFFPLTVDYEERFYAAGKISGSRFIKRENRPSEQAILTARLIDRPLRPLFPKQCRHPIQVIVMALSFDGQHQPDIVAMIAASAALKLAGAPLQQPIVAFRVGRVAEQLILNPTESQLEQSDLDLVVAGIEDRVMMIEAGGQEVNESIILEAVDLAIKNFGPILAIQEQLAQGIKPMILPEPDHHLPQAIRQFLGDRIHKLLDSKEKTARETEQAQLEQALVAQFEGQYKQTDLIGTLNSILGQEIRQRILQKGERPDGRAMTEIRPLDIEVGLLPRTHGSALFARGQSQCLTIATLGAPGDVQFIDTMEQEGTKRFMHHYNFPPFSTGEIRFIRAPSRREIGHGALAERALLPVIPEQENFPYTIRLVSELLSSNGSTSMAATCGSTLALMDAGVPIKAPVAGIAIGLVTQQTQISKLKTQNYQDYILLTDIQGLEDFGGDMDFKVTGTRAGVTAIQLDIKISGLTLAIVKQALEQARIARLYLLDEMAKVISQPRPELSPYAPRIYSLRIDPLTIGDVIGPGGKTIRKIIDEAGGKELVSVDIEDDGLVMVSSTDKQAADKAIDEIKALTTQVEVGQIYTGQVTEIIKDRLRGNEIGAIVQLTPKKEGMIHISELADYRVGKVSDIVKVGETVKVKVVGIDPDKGRIALSKKQAEKI